jgi:DNA-binding protein H-NS
MKRTYESLLNEIEDLKERAERARREEMRGVIERIRAAIVHYGLTAQDLGFPSARAGSARSGRRALSRPVKYRDEAGHTWVGFGKPPTWFREALAAGRTREELLAQPMSAPPAGDGRRAQRSARYRDDAGHSWSGLGPRPRWLLEALATGKTLEDLKA